MSKLRVWFSNSLSFHHRLMANFLHKRGWVVFYLEKEHRTCTKVCWLALYESGCK